MCVFAAQLGEDDSRHFQTDLEEPELSEFYEENPPRDESWKYTLWEERSCETGWWWPGWTFDGEFWFHWAFHSLKVNIIKSGLPWRAWKKRIISVHSGFCCSQVNLCDAKQKHKNRREFRGFSFHAVSVCSEGCCSTDDSLKTFTAFIFFKWRPWGHSLGQHPKDKGQTCSAWAAGDESSTSC